MLLFSFLTYTGMAAAMTCHIIGAGSANCRSCPSTDCDILEKFNTGSSQDFTCVWPDGGPVSGNKRWGYNNAHRCFVSGVRLGKCNINSVTDCVIGYAQGIAPP
ncbi:hypothetical protein BDV26DRAFT_252202 [Aspergillus bertholletiae]|uniref:Secreted protein n=1 Tax=Aspergillus bertholletiae TaxID=1226010 RepID=A0A5N7BMT7_9EURO|nr:hypothetical protein BDV26DRAFT_252202 [Aspergillus bertholletiae]